MPRLINTSIALLGHQDVAEGWSKEPGELEVKNPQIMRMTINALVQRRPNKLRNERVESRRNERQKLAKINIAL